MELSPFDIQQLYGESFLKLGAAESEIEWKSKPNSLVFYALSKQEFFNKALTEQLRKIVISIGITEKEAGFGLISGTPPPDKFFESPGNITIVFGRQFLSNTQYLITQGEKKIYFAGNLTELAENKMLKKELWDFLKEVQSEIKR